MKHPLDNGQLIQGSPGEPITDEDMRYAYLEGLEQWKRNRHKLLRAEEYPPITDYLDGVVKGDQAQIDAYIAACQAVKAKYPKPE